MFRSARGAVGALFAGALLASVVAFTAPSGATLAPSPTALVPSFTGFFFEGMLEATVGVAGACDSNITATQVTVLKNGQPTNDVAIVELASPTTFGLVIGPGASSAPPATNGLNLSMTCPVSTVPTVFTGVIGWAQIDVTKTVVGDGPADGEFEITAVCTRNALASVDPASITPSFISSTTLEIPLKAGETGSVFAVSNGICTFTETNSLGAIESTVDNPSITIASSTTQSVSVTNTFPEITPRYTG